MTLTPVQQLCDYEDVVIANGASVSGAINMNNRILTGIYMPAAWTAAGLTFQGSPDGTTYYNIQSDASEYAAVATISQYIALDWTKFLGARFIKVRSGTAASAVVQLAARTLTLACGAPTRS